MVSKLQVSVIPVTAYQQNCTLMWDEESKYGVIVDPGGELDRIGSAIEQSGMLAQAIWITHGHIDHAAGAMDLKERLGIDIVGPHKDDAELLQSIAQQAQMFGTPGNFRNCQPDRWLQEGDILSIADHAFEVFHCPGHAPGHVVFYNERSRFAQVGDVLFAGSIGRTDLPGGNHEQLIDSIESKLMKWPDDVQFVCGHGPTSTIGRERATNPFLN